MLFLVYMQPVGREWDLNPGELGFKASSVWPPRPRRSGPYYMLSLSAAERGVSRDVSGWRLAV